ncbi:MAG: hypothetical protein PVG89_09015 [Gammaproteobacteria bacterium]|jgi:hypothetical protein
MTDVQQADRFSLKAMIFVLVFFVSQSALVFADFNHPLHLDNDACSICLAANHLSNGLIQLPVTVTACANSSITVTSLCTLSRSSDFLAYAVRAPPLS